ncbi:hypothetical protein GQ43DRAFT_75346 [Delitschia confertaspora ATCC 74209]|uniref:Uncharacterized protein n=1 Tax=Delitschia confertaspora ATCC 74209 TaxID=1513339 RepID=A0A9P4JXJ1_9PLEO|nr:hypothetical protein GQ43DRAFT_75346 [Delitschia confertaspora ATCC 74209]
MSVPFVSVASGSSLDKHGFWVSVFLGTRFAMYDNICTVFGSFRCGFESAARRLATAVMGAPRVTILTCLRQRHLSWPVKDPLLRLFCISSIDSALASKKEIQKAKPSHSIPFTVTNTWTITIRSCHLLRPITTSIFVSAEIHWRILLILHSGCICINPPTDILLSFRQGAYFPDP